MVLAFFNRIESRKIGLNGFPIVDAGPAQKFSSEVRGRVGQEQILKALSLHIENPKGKAAKVSFTVILNFGAAIGKAGQRRISGSSLKNSLGIFRCQIAIDDQLSHGAVADKRDAFAPSLRSRGLGLDSIADQTISGSVAALAALQRGASAEAGMSAFARCGHAAALVISSDVPITACPNQTMTSSG
jgi:hypothetical protein